MKALRQLIAVCGLAVLGGAALAEEAVQLKIPAQALSDALAEFAQQTGLQLIASSDLTKGLRAGAVEGAYTREEGLKQLLAGAGLDFSFINDRTVAIRGAQGKELGGRPTAESLYWEPAKAARVAQGEGKEGGSEGRGNAGSGKEEVGADTKLDEIVVTAQKKTERLQDVPISIGVITAEDIDRRGLVTADDYLRGIPGVNQTTDSMRGGSIIIRGIETQPATQNFNNGAPVATYFGETPTTTSAGLNGNMNVDTILVDIERVEVLRGPQGTTFGSGSLGGAVRVIPVAPKLGAIEGKVAAGYSTTSGTSGSANLQAIANMPIGDKLAVRAVAYRYTESGFYRNTAGSSASFQAAAARWGAQQFALNREDMGDVTVNGGRISALFQASDALRFTLTYLKQQTLGQIASASTGKYDFNELQLAPVDRRHGDTGPFNEAKLDIGNVTMEYDFRWADLLATYSHVEGNGTIAYLFSILPALPWSVYSPSENRSNTGEVRLSTRFSGPLNFLGGLYYEHVQDESPAEVLWFGNPLLNPFDPNPATAPNPVAGTDYTSRNLVQRAAFGEVTWKILPRLNFTGGVRAYQYDRSSFNQRDGVIFGGLRVTDVSTDKSGTTFRANLSSKITDDVLLYAGWSQGFRLGSIRPGVSGVLCDLNSDGFIDGSGVTVESTRHVDPDNVDDYELGAKLTFLDHRLTVDADVFHIDWVGVPITKVIQCNNGANQSYTANAGNALSEGVEFQSNLRIARGFQATMGASWMNAHLTKDVPAQGWHDGDRLPGSPKVNANAGLQYEFSVGNFPAFVRTDAIYVGPFFGAVGEPAGAGSAGGYVKVDLSARLAIDKTNIDFFVRNLTNRDEFTFRGAANPSATDPYSGYLLRPRTIGVQLSHSF